MFPADAPRADGEFQCRVVRCEADIVRELWEGYARHLATAVVRYYLKGEPAAACITNGQSVLDRQRELKKGNKGPPRMTTAPE